MANKVLGWRKVAVFGIAIIAVVILTLKGGLPMEQAIEAIKYIALGFFAGNGIEHLGKLIKPQ